MPFDIPNKPSENNTPTEFELKNSIEEVISESEFFKDMSQDKEKFEFDNNKFNDPPPFVQEYENPDERKKIRSKAEKSAAFVVKHLDNGLAWGASEIALAEKPDDFHASNDDKNEMILYWTDILEANKGNIPTWLMLLISASLTYGPIYSQAFKARAINKVIARRAAKAEAELEILKQKEKQKSEKKPDNKSDSLKNNENNIT